MNQLSSSNCRVLQIALLRRKATERERLFECAAAFEDDLGFSDDD
jgi:hypothetical protein